MSQEQDGTPPPEVIRAVPIEPGEPSPETGHQETIAEPAKLLRIASMVRELLDETRQATLDEPGRKRLADIYGRAVGELTDVLSEDLREELGQLAPPMESGVPTESELRVAQAQLVGWLEGLFHGSRPRCSRSKPRPAPSSRSSAVAACSHRTRSKTNLRRTPPIPAASTSSGRLATRWFGNADAPARGIASAGETLGKVDRDRTRAPSRSRRRRSPRAGSAGAGSR